MSKNFNIDFDKLKFIKDVYSFTKSEEKFLNDNKFTFQTYMRKGDIQPAYVYSINPLIISCYNDEIDNVNLLQFPDEFVDKYDLKEGDHLITSNVYWTKHKTKYKDILPGISNNMRYFDVYPFILKFLIKDEDLNIDVKFSNFIWEYVENLTYAYFKFTEGTKRDGFFYMFKGDRRG